MVNISKQDNAIIFAFTDSTYYLYGTGSIEVPMNALSLVIDESDMITFRKASSNDIFVSIPLDETNFSTKADVIDFYKENMVGSSGSADAFTGVSYDGTNQEIIFTNKDDEEVATLDASAFVIDGMVENVKVENGYLVIDFNTASGKQDIYIPLTSFFDASQYYTKTEVDNTFLTKAVFDVKEDVIMDALNQLDEDKVDASDLATVATSGSYDDLTNKPTIPAAQVQSDWNQSDSSAVDFIKNKPTIPDTSDFVTVSQYNPKEQAIAEALTDLHENKADKTELPDMTDYYDKTETDTAISTAIATIDLSGYVDKSTFDVKEEVISTALNQLNENKADKAELPDMTDYYDKTEVDNLLPDMTNYYNKTEVDTQLENIEEVVSQSLNDFADTIERNESVTAQALTNLNTTKANSSDLATVATSGSYNDLSDKPTIPAPQVQSDWNAVSGMGVILNKPTIPDMTDYYDKTETDTAISTAIATIDLSGYVDKTTFDVKEEVISRALNALNSEIGDINTILQSI